MFRKPEASQQVSEITRLVSNRVAGLTNRSADELDGFMRSIIHEIATDKNAYEFAYDIMARVAIKRHQIMVREEEEFAKRFELSVINFWQEQLEK